MLLEVMGRHAGWIATYAGMANGADAILIPEIPLDKSKIKELCQMLIKRNQKGTTFSVIVVAEGTIVEGRTTGRQIFTISKNEMNFQLGGVGNSLAKIIEEKTGLETRVSSLGYIQRGGTPVAYDRSLATAFGVKAIELIRDKKYGQMTALKRNSITNVPLEKVENRIKTVNRNGYRIAEKIFG